MYRRLLPLVLAAVLTPAAAPRAQEYSDLSHRLESQQNMLEQINADLRLAREDAERIRARERNVSRRLVDVTNTISQTEHTIARLTRAERQLRRDMTAASARVDTLSAQISDRRAIMERRVRVLYMQGRRQPYQRALLASSLRHWLAARQYMSTLNRRDEIDVVHLEADRREFERMVALYTQQRETLDSLLSTRRTQREELLASQTEARTLFRRVRSSRTLAERAAEELEEQQRESEQRVLEYLAARQQAGSAARGSALVGSASALVDFTQLRGVLPWPVEGAVLRRFGRTRDAVTRTWTRNRGIDIAAARGTNVQAAANGQVAMVDWAPGYGTFVIIAHGGDHYTLYANLGSVAVQREQHVNQGDTIGATGASGMGEERLHFELLAGAEAVDPLEWLEPRDEGR